MKRHAARYGAMVLAALVSSMAGAATPFDDSGTITVGTTRTVSTSGDAASVKTPGEPATVCPANPAATEAAPPAKGKTYVVKPNDTLWSIAQRFLGDPSLYAKIIAANAAKYPSLLKNPDLIMPGWELEMPGEAPAASPVNPAVPGGVSGTTPGTTAGTAPDDSAPPALNAGRARVLNEVRYGCNRLVEKLQSGDSTLAPTLEWLLPYVEKLREFANPEDATLIAYVEKQVGLARDKLVAQGNPLPPALPPVSQPPVPASDQNPSDQGAREKQALLNDLRYAVSQVQAKMNSGDPSLAETVASARELLSRFAAVRVDADNSEYLRLLQVIREGEKRVAQQQPPVGPDGAPVISPKGQQQMRAVVEYAKTHHTGASRGYCFNAVWGYLTTSGYGKLDAWGDLPGMGSDEARFFSEYLNASQKNLDEAGLQRLDTALKPPITNPHDSRIPVGAVIVVSDHSYGTVHETAGDIVVKAGPSHFINDGPNMNYGTSSSWYGKVLGVYVPK